MSEFSQPEQNASIKYKVPLEDPLNNYLSYQAGVKAENDNDTQSEALTLAVQRHWGSQQSDWQRIGFLRLEQEKFTQGTDDQQTTTLLLPGLTLSRRRARGGLDINWGDKQQYTLEGATQEVVSDIDLVRISLQSKWLRSYGKHRVFVRAELGAIATNDFSQVPSSLRYFAGGDQSVRGFALNTLSPEEDDELTGGQYLNVASAEYSYPVSQNWRMALFTDIGNASDKPFKDLATGIGLGASWSSPVGPIRFYFARGNSVEETTWRFHFSMKLLKYLAIFLGCAILLLALIASPWGTRGVLSIADSSLDSLDIDYDSGSLLSELSLKRITFVTPEINLQVSKLVVDVNWSCVATMQACLSNYLSHTCFC